MPNNDIMVNINAKQLSVCPPEYAIGDQKSTHEFIVYVVLHESFIHLYLLLVAYHCARFLRLVHYSPTNIQLANNIMALLSFSWNKLYLMKSTAEPSNFPVYWEFSCMLVLMSGALVTHLLKCGTSFVVNVNAQGFHSLNPATNWRTCAVVHVCQVFS